MYTFFKNSIFILMCFVISNASIASIDNVSSKSKLALVFESFPSADRIEISETKAKGESIYSGKSILGYLLYTDETYPIPAYSGKPIRAMVTLNTKGEIQKVNIISHEEPILVVGLTNTELRAFTDQYDNLAFDTKVKLGKQIKEGYKNIDGISGATITAMVLHQSIIKSVKRVMQSRGDAAPANFETLDTNDSTSSVWMEHWLDHQWEIALLIFALFVLTVLLFLQDWVVMHPKYFHIFRVSFLVFTLLFLGVYLKAQLSIINIITFIQILSSGFSWNTLLIDPYIFILWAFVAFSILLWGRGIYCGWLCPFGALQELLSKIALKLKVRQFHIPSIVHERLWAIKYIVLMCLVGLSLESLTLVIPFVDIEPFKTTFSLQFDRPWYFVFYVLVLLSIGIFNAKFYCKYICPLGAALSIGTRFRIFDWLRRRKECGSPCHACANACSVGAIRQTGEIIENECHYCLECQATYWDDHKCPPMVSKREREERRNNRKQLIPNKQVD